MLFLLQAGKANIYWRGYFWLSVVVSPEPLNIPTSPYFWQLLLQLGSKSKVRRVVASLGRTPGDTAPYRRRHAVCLWPLFGRLPVQTNSLWLPSVPAVKGRKVP